MSRISDVFSHDRKALIAYVTVGYPSIDVTLAVVPLLSQLGCDIVELGIPFSDPLADGATIQKASYVALSNGITPQVCLDIAGQLRQETDIPLVFMTYFNPILNHGLPAFAAACAAKGIDGLIVPDMPPEEGGDLERETQRHGIDLVYLLAPTSTEERTRLVARHSRGFIYLVSIAGVTGARQQLPEGLEEFVRRVKNVSTQPLCVGFGISTPQQAAEVARYADGVIVGSRLVQLMEGLDWQKEVSKFVASLRQSLDNCNN
jgi:tryptophan synthase alpha chain